jgi:hypothetical protein
VGGRDIINPSLQAVEALLSGGGGQRSEGGGSRSEGGHTQLNAPTLLVQDDSETYRNLLREKAQAMLTSTKVLALLAQECKY